MRSVAAIADKSDTGEINARNAGAQGLDDLIRKAVCGLAGRAFVRSCHVALRSQDIGFRGVLNVEESARENKVLVKDLGLSEYQHLGGRGRISPSLEVHVPGF